MNFPIKLSFKLFALAPQITVTDASGTELAYVRQKLLALREKVTVFTDHSQKTPICLIQANKIIDWSARYIFTDPAGGELGSVGRKGFKSMWRASYEVFAPDSNVHEFTITEENPMSKVMDSMLGGIPVLGMLSGFLFHPRYAINDAAGNTLLRVHKRRAFFEGNFEVESLVDLPEAAEVRIMFSLLMMVLLERARG